MKKKRKRNRKIYQGKSIWKEGDFPLINPDAAGIDIGSESMYVAVPNDDRAKESVRKFGTFTRDLIELAAWLKSCGIKTVAMESTGVYWVVIYSILVERGFDVNLVNARHVKNLPGRKTDVLDCQWIQKLHTYGLLSGSFIPSEEIVGLRSYLRQRNGFVKEKARSIHHMQKAMIQMNLLLHNVVSDISGETGMRIINAILAGERDPNKLANLRDRRCKKTKEEIALALEGNFRKEHLFSLKSAMNDYNHYKRQIISCDKEIQKHFQIFEQVKNNTGEKKSFPTEKKTANSISFDVKDYLYCTFGVDLTMIPGIKSLTAINLLSEIGYDMSKWKSVAHFSSWNGLCPDNKITGDKVKSSKTRNVPSRAASIFRLAAQSLKFSEDPLGRYFRRMKAKLGPAEAITATAHKLARIVYSMIKHKKEYDPSILERNELLREKSRLSYLKRKAKKLGYKLIPLEPTDISNLQPLEEETAA